MAKGCIRKRSLASAALAMDLVGVLLRDFVGI